MNMHQDLPSLSIGQRIEFHRKRTGKTRAVLAGLVGMSVEWLRSIETGRRLPPRLEMLEQLATALKVPLSDLVGEQYAQIRALSGPAHAALSEVRSAINSHPAVDDTPLNLDDLAQRVAAAWRARHASPDHRTTVGALLPGLIRDTRAATAVLTGPQRQLAYGLEADTLGLAQMFLAYQPAPELLWRVAERAMMASREANDAHARALASWFMVEALRDAGDWDSAMEINLAAIDDAEQHVNGHVNLTAMVGALHTVAALTAARAGEEGRAWRHQDTAEQVMRHIPLHIHPRTWFSDAVVGFYALSVNVELRKGAAAVRTAKRIDPQAITSRPRRARHLIEVARAHYLRADAQAALDAVAAAVDAAPETVKYNSHARNIVLELREDSARRSAAGQLAAKIGL